MQNVSNQPQTPRESERGYAPQQSLEYPEGYSPQGGYRQQPYPPGHSYPPPYQDQQPYGSWMPGEVSPFERTSMGIKARTAGVLCYLFSWVGGLIFFLLERDNRFVRFHAVQSILFFGALSIVEWFFSYFPFAFFGLGGIVGLLGFVGWIVLMVAAHRGRYYKLPLFGDLAEQVVSRPAR